MDRKRSTRLTLATILIRVVAQSIISDTNCLDFSMDRLTTLLNQFSLSAGVFYTGNICGVHGFEQDASQGHIHLIKRGPVQVIGVRREIMHITEPSVLFLPRPDTHRLVADEHAGADVVCATVKFGGG